MKKNANIFITIAFAGLVFGQSQAVVQIDPILISNAEEKAEEFEGMKGTLLSTKFSESRFVILLERFFNDITEYIKNLNASSMINKANNPQLFNQKYFFVTAKILLLMNNLIRFTNRELIKKNISSNDKIKLSSIHRDKKKTFTNLKNNLYEIYDVHEKDDGYITMLIYYTSWIPYQSRFKRSYLLDSPFKQQEVHTWENFRKKLAISIEKEKLGEEVAEIVAEAMAISKVKWENFRKKLAISIEKEKLGEEAAGIIAEAVAGPIAEKSGAMVAAMVATKGMAQQKMEAGLKKAVVMGQEIGKVAVEKPKIMEARLKKAVVMGQEIGKAASEGLIDRAVKLASTTAQSIGSLKKGIEYAKDWAEWSMIRATSQKQAFEDTRAVERAFAAIKENAKKVAVNAEYIDKIRKLAKNQALAAIQSITQKGGEVVEGTLSLVDFEIQWAIREEWGGQAGAISKALGQIAGTVTALTKN